MKVLFILILTYLFILSGCTPQFSNSKEVNRNLSERRNYDIASSYGSIEGNRYDQDTSMYGPQIDLGKALFEK